LSEGENLIGRDPESSVWLDVASVSRRHARIAVEKSGATLEDLKSKNGTKVGDASVATPVKLRDGDRIVVGTVPLTYRTSASGYSTETQLGGVHKEATSTGTSRIGAPRAHKSRTI
jgi:pSer/pThr/pTyr-binding forkhead associated (FHA) protein